MSLLGATLEPAEIEELRKLLPEYQGEIPVEAQYWSRGDLELFLGSGGQLRPREVGRSSVTTCALLTRVRHALADDNIGEATAEYRAFCKQLKVADEVHSLTGVAECTMIQRVPSFSKVMKTPEVTRSPKDWQARAWNMEFWKRECGGDWWKFRARAPVFEGDVQKPLVEQLFVDGSIGEYIDYVRTIQQMDPSCSADNSIAYFRVACDRWAPFAGSARPLFEKCWKELLPRHVQDLSMRWMKMFAADFNMDWLEFLARYFRVTIGAPGSISRLHCENNGAHAWFSQLEGRRLYVLFSPRDVASGCLYDEAGDVCEGAEGFAARASPVDVFFPNTRRHQLFSKAKPQVVILRQGETLLIPSGWWHYSVALEPSVTMRHPFWNIQNRQHMVAEFKETFEESRMPPELREIAMRNFDSLHERIMEDDDSDMDD